ncbi:MAG TPA: hypothetical protein PKI93_05205 [Alphaproteobacteria bacterium]|nr:hypothetical protein [Alphaproteobacteria bacterium]HNS45001.1 hypothetical protein [Alphaproteobacteria bacterium]
MTVQFGDVISGLLFDGFTVAVDDIPEVFSGVRGVRPRNKEEDWGIVVDVGGVEYEFATIPDAEGVGNKIYNAVHVLRNFCCI